MEADFSGGQSSPWAVAPRGRKEELLFRHYKRTRSWNPGCPSSNSTKLGYFLAWFQSLQLPSTQSESPLALIPLAPKFHVSFKVCSQLRIEFFIFSTVSIVSGYRLDDKRGWSFIAVRSRIFSSPCYPDPFWVPPSLLPNEYWHLFLRGKAARAWSWPLTSN
jgi:hypothetical protein